MQFESVQQFVSRLQGTAKLREPSKLTVRARAYALLLTGDVLALAIGLALASWIRLGDPFHAQTLAIMSVTLPLFAVFAARSLNIEALEDWLRGLLASYLALLSAFAVVLFVAFCLKTSTDMSRLVMIGGAALTVVLLFAWRMIAAPINRAILGGEAVSALLITDRIDDPVPPGVRHLDTSVCGLDGPLLEPYALDRLARRLEGHDSVVVACAPGRREEWTIVLRAMGLRAHILISELHDAEAVSPTNPWGWVEATVAEGPMQLRDRIIKRAFDIVLAATCLALMAPLFAVIALLIKLDSPGPVFFKQARVGQTNRMFRMLKFRSMYTEKCDRNGHVSTDRKDPRVTRFGQFIRRSSLDELPQIINILRGEMSFVGPRPHALGSKAGEELFWELDARYWRRHLLPPGLTGLAQVRGFRGATPEAEDLLHRLSADLEYIRGWSVLRDFAIIGRTLRVLVHKNAY